jgi:hypothetical protein
MKPWTLALAAALALATGCDRNKPLTPPSPKADTSSSTVPQAGTGGSAPVTQSSNSGSGNREDERNGSNPVSQQVDPNHAEQQRDFRNNEDGAGPKSSDTAPLRNNARP